jgi:hypothetical protein
MMLILDECLCIHLEAIKNGLVDGTGEVIQVGEDDKLINMQ